MFRIFIFIAMLFASQNLFATTYRFTTAGLWSEATNWASSNMPPLSLSGSHTIRIQATCEMDVSQSIDGGTSLVFSGGTITNGGGDFTIGTGGTITVSASMAIDYINIAGGTINVNNTLTVATGFDHDAGSIVINSGGILNSGGATTSVGNITVSSGGTFNVTDGSSFSQTGGSFTVNGIVNITGSYDGSGGSLTTSTPDGDIEIDGTATLDGVTFTNNDFAQFDGNFSFLSGTWSSSGTLQLSGSSNQAISALTATTVILNNSNNITLNGDLNISTGGSLSITNGNIVTSNLHKVVLVGTATISGETSSHYVIGQLRATTTNTSSTFGGSGVTLTLTGGSGGTITMDRYTGTSTAGNGNTGLQRWVEIDATSAGYTTASLVMSYFDSELGTIDPESSMKAFSTSAASNETDNSAAWTGVTEVVDASANTITITGLTPALLDGFSFTGGDDGQVLPITLSKFIATYNSSTNAATLNWTTATEENNEGFEIQRSIDGQNFDVIAYVSGAGNSINEINYEYIDNSISGLATAKLYYRLRQIDFDGEYSFSSTRVIDLNKSEAQFKWFPNPANNQIVIETGNSAYTQIFDLTGRKLLDIENAGNPMIDITSLEMGSYIIRFLDVSGNMLSQDRLIKN